MTKQIKFLKRRRELLIDTLNEYIEDKIYTESAIAEILWTYRQRINTVRKWKAVILPDEVEKYLNLLKV